MTSTALASAGGSSLPAPLGFIDHLFAPDTTDVVLNSAPIALSRVNGAWQSHPSPFGTGGELENWMIDLFEQQGVSLNFRRPMATMVKEGFRYHGVLPHGVSNQTQLVIRRLHRGEPAPVEFWQGDNLRRFRILAEAMRGGSSVLVVGAAGAGKTTLLRQLLLQLSQFRLITIEDTPELGVVGDNVVSLVARDANQDGLGQISMADLLTEALRMSPDRIAVGEVRSVELAVMLEALNTGQAGGGATMHANSVRDLTSRLESIGLRAGVPLGSLIRQVESAISLVAFVQRSKGYEIAALAKPRVSASGLEFIRVD